jgi:hypothetical protein
VKLPAGLLGDLADRLVQRQAGIFRRRAVVDLVVHVGDVAGVDDVIGPEDMAQQAEQNVEDDQRPGVADVSEVIDRGAAHVHAHALRVDGYECPLVTGESVVELQFHYPTLRQRQLKCLIFEGAEHGRRRPLPAGLAVISGREKTRPRRRVASSNLRTDAANRRNADHGRHNGLTRRRRQGGSSKFRGAPGANLAYAELNLPSATNRLLGRSDFCREIEPASGFGLLITS